MRITGLVVVVLFFVSCEGGLQPIDVEPGFGGTVTFEGAWPPVDSLVNLWIVASQDYPLDSAKVIAGIIANPPRIYLYPSVAGSLPINVASIQYEFSLPPAEYKYIAVVQHMNSDFDVSSLRVVGLYGMPANQDEPQAVTVSATEFIRNIDITVNFDQPPPQPF